MRSDKKPDMIWLNECVGRGNSKDIIYFTQEDFDNGFGDVKQVKKKQA